MTVIGLANERRTEKPPGFLIITRSAFQSKSGHNPANTKYLDHICTTSAQVFDVGLTLYKCYTNVLCSLGMGIRRGWL